MVVMHFLHDMHNTLETATRFYENIPLDNGKHPCTPKHTLGTLEQLPLEITYMILLKLDIRSLTDFRRVNQRAMQMVSSIPQYKKIILHAPNTIRGSLSIDTANLFSCQYLYEKLCRAECETCGKKGGYLYLITCRRVCFNCFNEKPQFLPLLRTDAQRKFGLNHKVPPTLPSMRSIPGHFAQMTYRSCNRIILVDHDAARRAGIATHGSVSAMEKYAADVLEKKWQQYKRREEKFEIRGYLDGPEPRQPKIQDDIDEGRRNPKRYMGIVKAPIFNARTGSPESVS